MRTKRDSRHQRCWSGHFSGHVADAEHVTGPVSFLNPTTRFLPVERRAGDCAKPAGAGAATAASGLPRVQRDAGSGVYHIWRSRDNRKGRHSVAVTRACRDGKETSVPTPTNTLRASLTGIRKMLVRFPVWDVSYDIAIIFTLGSVVWVFNAFFVWYPLAAPGTEFPGETTMGGGVTAFVGATIFEFGSVLLMLEAVNETREDCFGWALEEAWERRPSRPSGPVEEAHHGRSALVLRPHADCRHPHRSKTSLFPKSQVSESNAAGDSRQRPSQRTWAWWPTWYELRTHYLLEIGFLASLSQMVGATVFWIAGFTSLPPILNSLSVPAENGTFWLPQVVGGIGFIISSLLFMLETQRKWWRPEPKVLGWHIGFWNLIGALGFTACGAVGFGGDREAIEYASTLSTFVGSWAFLIGSGIQWYESLDKYTLATVKEIPSRPHNDAEIS